MNTSSRLTLPELKTLVDAKISADITGELHMRYSNLLKYIVEFEAHLVEMRRLNPFLQEATLGDRVLDFLNITYQFLSDDTITAANIESRVVDIYKNINKYLMDEFKSNGGMSKIQTSGLSSGDKPEGLPNVIPIVTCVSRDPGSTSTATILFQLLRELYPNTIGQTSNEWDVTKIKNIRDIIDKMNAEDNKAIFVFFLTHGSHNPLENVAVANTIKESFQMDPLLLQLIMEGRIKFIITGTLALDTIKEPGSPYYLYGLKDTEYNKDGSIKNELPLHYALSKFLSYLILCSVLHSEIQPFIDEFMPFYNKCMAQKFLTDIDQKELNRFVCVFESLYEWDDFKIVKELSMFFSNMHPLRHCPSGDTLSVNQKLNIVANHINFRTSVAMPTLEAAVLHVIKLFEMVA